MRATKGDIFFHVSLNTVILLAAVGNLLVWLLVTVPPPASGLTAALILGITALYFFSITLPTIRDYRKKKRKKKR